MYERPRKNVKVEPRSTLAFTRGLSYIASILIIYVRKIYQRSQGKITLQWKSTLTDLINREGPAVYSVRAVGRSVLRLPASWSLYRRQRRHVTITDCVFNLILFADKLYSISELFVYLCFDSRRRNTSCFLLTRSQPQFDLNTVRQKSGFCALSYGSCSFLNPLSPNGDQHQFSPNNNHTLSRNKVIYENL